MTWTVDKDLPAGFDPDDLDSDMFEDFPEADPAKEFLAGEE